MIVRTLADLMDTDKNIKAPNGNWQSVRMLLKNDNMGFSFHITTIFANTTTHIHYKNHLEAVYCISGSGEVETIVDGKKHQIKAGTIYALNNHDEHYLRAFDEDLILACVFNPPLTGNEVHDKDGVYPID